MTYAPINVAAKFGMFADRWTPKIVARMNDYHLKPATRAAT